MDPRQPSDRGAQATRRWRVAERVRERAAPELASCEAFSTQLGFDRAALILAASVDEAWALRGSDPDLQRLLMQEQTVLQGPNTDALAALTAVSLTDVGGGVTQWPLLLQTGVFDDARYRCLVVVPVGGSLLVPPVGTFCLARDSLRPITARETGQAMRFARVLAGLLLFRWRAVRDVDRFEGLVLDQRHLAAGLLASVLGVRTQQALAVMRARAFSEGTTLAELSTEIVEALAA